MALLAMMGTWLLAGGIIGLADVLLLRVKGVWSRIGTVVFDVLSVNIVAMLVLRFVLARTNFLNPEAYLTPFWYKYVLFAWVFGVIYLVFKAALRGALAVVADHTEMSKKRIAGTIVAMLGTVLGGFCLWGTWWFLDFFGKLEPEQFMFNLYSPVGGAAGDAMNDIYTRPVLLLVATCVVMAVLLWAPAALRIGAHTMSRKLRQNIAFVLAGLVFFGGVTFGVVGMQVPAIVTQLTHPSTYIADNYVDPKSATITFPEKKRNLIHIYYESVESSFLDKEHGGYMDENLLPDLMALTDQGVHFSNTSKPYGGAHQIFGTGWSTAGMTNMNLGVPMKVPTDGNSYGLDGKFMPGAWGYTDVLASQGYNQEIILGCESAFGGIDALYKRHGLTKIFDPTSARAAGKIPADYHVWWGFEDNKLYDFAREELSNLASEGEPFTFIVANTDTHFPDGYLEPDAEKKFDKQYANVIYDSQRKMAAFIRWIQEQPFAENTTIVITGDHLSMDQNFFADWDPSYERTAFNAFLNPAFANKNFPVTDRQYASYDYLPTILASLGARIEGDRLALGTNLASGEKTLAERDGVEQLNKETSYYSQFFADKILGGKPAEDK